ncbi:MAG: hypothetical protein AAF585_10495 [Verrucomicrobiota bacterium]
MRKRSVAICGAGPIGKRLGRLLINAGIAVLAYYEVSERRIGNVIHGAPVWGSRSIESPPYPVLISAVGSRGGRERVRGLILGKTFCDIEGENAVTIQYKEGVDFFCVA